METYPQQSCLWILNMATLTLALDLEGVLIKDAVS